MKKIYSLICLTVLTTVHSFAQGVAIQDYNNGNPSGPNLNGTVINLTVTEGEFSVVNLGITNNLGVDKQMNIGLSKIISNAAWSAGDQGNGVLPEQLCWGAVPDAEFNAVCLEPNTNPWATPNNPTITDGGFGYLKFDITAMNQGSIHYRFYVLDGTTKLDSVDLVISTGLAVKAPKTEEVSLSVYPNPVSNTLSIATQGLGDDFNVKITDVLGKVVYNDWASAATKKIDVSEFKNGVYMVTVSEKGVATQTRRIVVKH
jgi:hypothetical protein